MSTIMRYCLILLLALFTHKCDLFGQEWEAWENLYKDENLAVDVRFKIKDRSCDNDDKTLISYKVVGKLSSLPDYLVWKIDYVDCNDKVVYQEHTLDLSIGNKSCNGNQIAYGDTWVYPEDEFAAKKILTRYYDVKHSPKPTRRIGEKATIDSLPASAHAQSNPQNGQQTVYFDRRHHVVSEAKAVYYTVFSWVNGKISNPTNEYYISGKLHWTGDVLSYTENEFITNGLCTWYDEDGIKKYQVVVSSNSWNGKFRAWWPTGKLKEKSTYLNGTKVGCQYLYDENGNCISAQLMMDVDYKKTHSDPIKCECAENRSTVSSNGTYYGTGLVRDHISGNLSKQESVLFRLLSNSKYEQPLVYLNFNFHEVDNNKQSAANAIYFGLVNTKYFKRIFSDNYNQILNEPIYYSMGYSYLDIHVATVDRSASTSGPRIAYLAVITCNLWVRNDKGDLIMNETFKGETNKMILGSYTGFSYATPEEAIKNSIQNLQNRITKYFKKEFSFN